MFNLYKCCRIVCFQVQDVKFQAQTPDEKEAWIKALNEGINKAKNKIFDEVFDVIQLLFLLVFG